MATTTMLTVSDRVRELAAEACEKRQTFDAAERRLKELLALKEADDPEGFHEAALLLPEARLAPHRAAADCLIVEDELERAREQARETIQRERAPGREKLIDKFHRALIEARDCRRDLLAFDAETERLLDGRSAGQSPAWAQLEELDSWRKAIA